MLTHANGTFGQQLTYTVTGSSSTLGDGLASGGDLNGDARWDIVTSGYVSTDSFSGANGAHIAEMLSPTQFTNYARQITFAGDVNGDSYGDWLVSGIDYTHPFRCDFPTVGTRRGGAYVLSGYDNSILRSFSSANANNHEDLFGYSSDAIGDINGDGKPEILVGAPNELQTGCGTPGGGAAHLYSGANGAEIRVHTSTGIWVSGISDVNADGKEDYATNDFVNIRVYSGSSGSQLYSLSALEDHYGGAGGCGSRSLSDIVRRLGDVTADGVPDFLVGTEGDQLTKGFVRVISGADGTEVYRVSGDANGDCFGASVAKLTDLNGDGKVDFAVGAPFHQNDLPFPAPRPHGYVRIISGGTGETISRIDSPFSGGDRDYFGYQLAYMSDINNNGSIELAIAAPYLPGRIYVYSLPTPMAPPAGPAICTFYSADDGAGATSLIPICRRQ